MACIQLPELTAREAAADTTTDAGSGTPVFPADASNESVRSFYAKVTPPALAHGHGTDELRRCAPASQLYATLASNRKPQCKWSTSAELALLTQLWGRMANREARAFDFEHVSTTMAPRDTNATRQGP